MPLWLIFYQLCFPLLGVGVLVRFLLEGRGRVLRESLDQIRQRLGLLTPRELTRIEANIRGDASDLPSPRGRVLWIHAASAGEVNAAAPLIAGLTGSSDLPRILLTSSTVAGRERAAQLRGVDLAVLAPLDFYPAIQSFLRRVRPAALILVETELWPLTLYLARKRGIPLAIVNGRLSSRSFTRYRWIRGLMRPLLSVVRVAAVQTENDAARFRELGAPAADISVAGNLKLDAAAPGETQRHHSEAVFAALGWIGDPVWIAGSTRPGEEESVLDAFDALRRNHPRLRLVLAPRHVERAPEVAALLALRNVRHAAFSAVDLSGTLAPHERPSPSKRPADPSSSSAPDCLLLDRLGHLAEFYANGTVAFVGGTLVPVGGHNLIEPAMSSLPVLYGPHTESQAEAARALGASGGGVRVADASELALEIGRLLADPAQRGEMGRKAREAAQKLCGATRRTLDLLEPFLRPPA